mmetsp:Transcript_36367/g.69792  ORF Transcript_36367/g.69792 Transcript_36367/m.69792 type:complete len:164 (+) Transcript_36367:97-588(+)
MRTSCAMMVPLIMMLLFVGSTAAERLNETSAYLTCITTPASCTRMSMRNISLAGSLPSELGTLSSLGDLGLWSNNLTGSIPSELGALTRLGNLHLSSNQLTGSLPSELGGINEILDCNNPGWSDPEHALRLVPDRGGPWHQLAARVPSHNPHHRVSNVSNICS